MCGGGGKVKNEWPPYRKSSKASFNLVFVIFAEVVFELSCFGIDEGFTLTVGRIFNLIVTIFLVGMGRGWREVVDWLAS